MLRSFTLALPALAALSGCGEHPASEGISAAAAATTGTAVLRDPPNGSDCAGQDLHLTRDHARLVIHGACRTVVIQASDGSLSLDKAQALHLLGHRYTALMTESARVEVAGNGNTLDLTRAGQVEISGDGNQVRSRSLDSVNLSGSGNTVDAGNGPRLDDRGHRNRVL